MPVREEADRRAAVGAMRLQSGRQAESHRYSSHIPGDYLDGEIATPHRVICTLRYSSGEDAPGTKDYPEPVETLPRQIILCIYTVADNAAAFAEVQIVK